MKCKHRVCSHRVQSQLSLTSAHLLEWSVVRSRPLVSPARSANALRAFRPSAPASLNASIELTLTKSPTVWTGYSLKDNNCVLATPPAWAQRGFVLGSYYTCMVKSTCSYCGGRMNGRSQIRAGWGVIEEYGGAKAWKCFSFLLVVWMYMHSNLLETENTFNCSTLTNRGQRGQRLVPGFVCAWRKTVTPCLERWNRIVLSPPVSGRKIIQFFIGLLMGRNRKKQCCRRVSLRQGSWKQCLVSMGQIKG